MLQHTRPRFHSITLSEDLCVPFAIVSSLDAESFSQIDTSTVLFSLCREINSLTGFHNRLIMDPDRTGTAEAMEFLVRRTNIESTLLLATQGFHHMRATDQDARLREACCLAGSIFVNYVLRGSKPSHALILRTLKTRLIACVELFESELSGGLHDGMICQTASTAVLFWTLSVGGAMSLDAPEKAWFALQLSRAARNLGIGSWEGALPMIANFPWDEKLENEAWESIWVDLQATLTTSSVRYSA